MMPSEVNQNSYLRSSLLERSNMREKNVVIHISFVLTGSTRSSLGITYTELTVNQEHLYFKQNDSNISMQQITLIKTARFCYPYIKIHNIFIYIVSIETLDLSSIDKAPIINSHFVSFLDWKSLLKPEAVPLHLWES